MLYATINIRIKDTHNLTSLLEHGFKRVRRGDILHLALSFVKDIEDFSKLELFIKQSIVLLKENPSSWDVVELVDTLKKVFNLPETNIFFSKEAKKVLCEKNLVVPLNSGVKVLRPDRLVIFDDRVVVVDFKGQIPAPEIYKGYLHQVKEYTKLANLIFDLPARGYILFIEEPRVDMVSKT